LLDSLLGLAERLARAAQDRPADSAEPEWPDPNRWLHDMLLTAEFFARDGRVGTAKGD
jgi:hypothetical protein